MSDDDLCQCPKCGRMHRHLSDTPPPDAATQIANFLFWFNRDHYASPEEAATALIKRLVRSDEL